MMIKTSAGILGLIVALAFSPALAEPFVTRSEYSENLRMQIDLNADTLKQLSRHGVTSRSKQELEYFYYLGKKKNARALCKSLKSRVSSCAYWAVKGERSLYVVNGWSLPVQMSKKTVNRWTREMCEIGYKHDAGFDGWGVLIDP